MPCVVANLNMKVESVFPFRINLRPKYLMCLA